MARLVLAALAAMILGQAVPGAEPVKDTANAAFMRTKKLPAKVTVDFKNLPFKDALEEISSQLEDKKLGPVKAHYGVGVSMNTRITYAAKDVTVAEALDGILKQLDLGYVVVSKDNDRYDGWLDIVKGSQRGYPEGVAVPKTGTEPKVDPKAPPKVDPKAPPKVDPKTPPKVEPKVEPKPESKVEPKPETPAVTEEDEKLAQSKLDLAKMLNDDGKKDRAIIQLKFVVKKYAGSKAAIEAKELLEKLEK